MIPYTKAHRNLLVFICIAFSSLTLLRLNGFSFSAWHTYIDDSNPVEILLGKPRGIRSDDWLLDLPLALAQNNHHPKFPMINENIGFGMNMTAPIAVPLTRLSLLFRPTSWGYFLGMDYGLSWMWWSKVFGLFYSFFLVFMILTRNRFSLSALGSLYLLFTPQIQFWSLHKSQIPMHAAFAFVGVFLILFSIKKRAIISGGILLGWSTLAFATEHIYPAFQVPIAYLFIFLLTSLIITRRSELQWNKDRNFRVLSVFISVFIVVAAGFSFFIDTKEAMQLITQTVYPGKRFSTGGEFPFWQLLSNHFFIVPYMKNWGLLSNFCEAASFLFFYPIIFVVYLLVSIKRKVKLDLVSISLLIYIFINLIYAYIGFPHWLAFISAYSRVTYNRTQLGLGIADICLLMLFLSNFDYRPLITETEKKMIIILWVITLGLSSWAFHKHIPEIPRLYLFLVCLGNGLLIYFLFYWKKTERIALLLTFIFIPYTIWFNPLVKGGTDYLFENNISKKILELNKIENGKSRWLVFGSSDYALVLSNLPRMIGVNSLGGYHLHPQPELWKLLDESQESKSIYNQCGFIGFVPSLKNKIEFISPSPGVIRVLINPDSPILKRLGINYFIFADGSTSPLDSNPNFKQVYSQYNKSIYQRVSD